MGRGAAFPPRPVGLEPGLEVLEASPLMLGAAGAGASGRWVCRAAG